jgi:UDP-N-acetylmuramate dehydrogenase
VPVLERETVDFKELKTLIKGKVELDHSIAPHTTYHLGGKAAAFVEPQAVEDLAELLRCLTYAQVPYLILGGGSNVLFADEGFRGVVIRLAGDSRASILKATGCGPRPPPNW